MYIYHSPGRSGGHFLCVTFATEQLQPVPVRGQWSAHSPYKVGSSLWYRWHVFGVTIGWTIAEASLSYNGSSYQGCIPAGRTHLAREDIRIYGCSPNWTAAPQIWMYASHTMRQCMHISLINSHWIITHSEHQPCSMYIALTTLHISQDIFHPLLHTQNSL